MIELSKEQWRASTDDCASYFSTASAYLYPLSMAVSVSLQHLSYHDAGLQGVSGAMVILRRATFKLGVAASTAIADPDHSQVPSHTIHSVVA